MVTNNMERLTQAIEDSDVVVQGVDGGEGAEDLSLCLIGRFLTDHPIRLQIMKDCMAGVWRPLGGITVREVETGLFSFQFYHQVDIQRVLKGGPWSFDKHLLILSTMQVGVLPNQLPLYAVPFWIQVHGFPPGFMSEAVGKSLSGCMGELLEYDVKNSQGSWCSFMRLRVLLDVRRPLLLTKKIQREGGVTVVVSFKYVILGSFCYLCGLLGHTDDFCPMLLTLSYDSGERGWEPELRVEARGKFQWRRE